MQTATKLLCVHLSGMAGSSAPAFKRATDLPGVKQAPQLSAAGDEVLPLQQIHTVWAGLRPV